MSVERVLMTTDTVGGVWTFALELAESLAARGTEVVLAAFGGKRALSSALSHGVCLLQSDFKLEWMEDPWADIEESRRWLLRLEREYCPDVIHLNSFGHGVSRWQAPVVLTAHSCVLSWWRAVKREEAPASWDRYRRLLNDSLRSADIVTAPSAEMAANMAVPCRVIPNGRNAAKFQRGTKEPFIFTAGRLWDEAKNVQAVAQVAPRLAWPVYVAGDTREIQSCRMLGRLNAAEMADWYARAAIYAMPARYEPFGLSILEAALSGCALVLGDIPSLREIWKDTALFVTPEDTRALERTLQMLIADPVRREELSGRAHARALTFDSGTMSRAYLDTYADAIALRTGQCVS